MTDFLTNVSSFTEAEREVVHRVSETSVEVLNSLNFEMIDAIALIINDHEGIDQYATEIWVNETGVVRDAVERGVRRSEARWLYEHWRPDSAKGEVLTAGESPTQDRGRYYSLVVAVSREIRQSIYELEQTVILIDNNHDYDPLVMAATAAANPDGQASEWLANPPPDC